MRLTDIMSHMNLAIWPQLGLIIFLIVFAAVVLRAMSSKRVYNDRMSALPLADDTATTTKTGNDEGTTRGA